MKPTNKSLAAALENASLQKKQPNIHMERAKREGISYMEAKARNYTDNYGITSKQFAEAVGITPERAKEVTEIILDKVSAIKKMISKLATGHLTPAYGRCFITSQQCLDWFNRGMDFENNDPTVPGRYCSIRDFAPGAQIQFRYGKRLQKTFLHTLAS